MEHKAVPRDTPCESPPSRESIIEECAQICDLMTDEQDASKQDSMGNGNMSGAITRARQAQTAADCATAIRALKTAAEAQRDELQKRIGYTAVPVAEGGANTDVKAWLIEMPDARWGSSYCWCGVRGIPSRHSPYRNVFGTVEQAIRFSRKEDAERVIEQICTDAAVKIKLEACEHMWPATGTAQATECETNGKGLRAELDSAKRALRTLRAWDMLNPGDGPEHTSDAPWARKIIDDALAAKSTEQKEGG